MTSIHVPASWPIPLPTLPLAGHLVRLEPLQREHAAALVRAGQDEVVWRYTTSYAGLVEAMRRYVDGLLRAYAEGTALPYVVRHLNTGRIVGVTRLKNLSRANRSALVGSWYDPTVWRTGVNVEAKLLLLAHAFEVLGCIRVEFHTDLQNTRSRTSLTRLGATQEGILRACQITRDGRLRDSVIFSVLDSEWPIVRQGLMARLASKR